MREPIPVLLYHGVPRGAGGDELAVPYELFRSHVRAMRASGRSPVTVGELAVGLRREAPLPPRPFAVTFDDGHADNLAAFDALALHGFTATLYVTTGSIDGTGMLSASQLRDLTGSQVEIGAHTVTHPRLDELDRADIDRELRTSRDRLEQLLGKEVTSFAYPYGAYDRRVRRAVAEAGFESAAAVKNAISHGRDDPFAIARWTVSGETTAATLTRILEGHDAPSAWRRERLRTRGYRAARRLRRRLARGEPSC
jgi:peptidoglycan/xylan/chitin deacetylase (PgdA/CDA1 family)